MADYSQLKVPDLKKLLQERGLVISGNKADLIARLQENDKKSDTGAGKQPIQVLRLIAMRRMLTVFQLAKMRSIGTKMITRQQLRQLLLPLLPEAKVKSQTPLPYRIKKSTPTPRRPQT
jgi:hypothetical protein